jgi:hypothetical protein
MAISWLSHRKYNSFVNSKKPLGTLPSGFFYVWLKIGIAVKSEDLAGTTNFNAIFVL